MTKDKLWFTQAESDGFCCGERYVIGSGDNEIGHVPDRALAAFIVQACNMHEELIETLRDIEDDLCSGRDRDDIVRGIRATLAKLDEMKKGQ